jgi:hypothetical protein
MADSCPSEGNTEEGPKCGIYAWPKTPAVRFCISAMKVEDGGEDKDLGLSFMSP